MSISGKYLYVWLVVLLHAGIGLSIFLIDHYHLDESRATQIGLTSVYFALLGLLFDRTFAFFIRHPEESKGSLEPLERMRIRGRLVYPLLSLFTLASAIARFYWSTSPALARAASSIAYAFLAGAALVSVFFMYVDWRRSHDRIG